MTQADLLAAAEVLAASRRRLRLPLPQLTRRYEDPAVCLEFLEPAFASAPAAQVVEQDGVMRGFALAELRDEQLWGPNVWFPTGHFTVAEPEYIGELYAAATQSWFEQGRTHHYVVVPACFEAQLWRWFELGFGIQQTLAVREVVAGAAEQSAVEGLVIRRATQDDAEIIAELDMLLPKHQALAPVFSAGRPPSVEQALADAVEVIDLPGYVMFVAEVDGQVVGSALMCDASESAMHSGLAEVPDAALLAFAAVTESARGQGIGKALGAAVLNEAAAQGRKYVVADWRSTNLLSSHAWWSGGYRPTFHRLHRVVGH